MSEYPEQSIMSDDQDYVKGIVIDVCTKSFLLISDQGDERMVQCENTKQFMDVLSVVTNNLTPEQIQYADLAITK
jgi:hypothetical protein